MINSSIQSIKLLQDYFPASLATIRAKRALPSLAQDASLANRL